MPFRARLAVLATALAAVVTTACGAAAARPSEDEVRQSITDMFTPIYTESWMAPGDLKIEFGEIQYGEAGERNLDGGYYGTPIPVQPVKVPVRIIVDRHANGVDTTMRGTQPNDVFFFYEDEFGKWAFRTGTL